MLSAICAFVDTLPKFIEPPTQIAKYIKYLHEDDIPLSCIGDVQSKFNNARSMMGESGLSVVGGVPVGSWRCIWAEAGMRYWGCPSLGPLIGGPRSMPRERSLLHSDWSMTWPSE